MAISATRRARISEEGRRRQRDAVGGFERSGPVDEGFEGVDGRCPRPGTGACSGCPWRRAGCWGRRSERRCEDQRSVPFVDPQSAASGASGLAVSLSPPMAAARASSGRSGDGSESSSGGGLLCGASRSVPTSQRSGGGGQRLDGG